VIPPYKVPRNPDLECGTLPRLDRKTTVGRDESAIQRARDFDMKINSGLRKLSIPLFMASVLAVVGCDTSLAEADTPLAVVTYEDFGAIGDGVADDLAAILAAHEYANQHGRPVRSNPEAVYHLGRRALTAIIQTDTDWGTSRFIIDDSPGVENHRLPLFEIRSKLEPVKLDIRQLARGQERLDLRPATDTFVLVENSNRRIFIRRGLNQNSGTPQREVFILRHDGSIEGAIDWDYDVITRVVALPMDPEPLVIRGGVFISIANQMRQEVGYNYWSRHIQISRSNTEIDGLTLRVTGETEVGHPYIGFLRAQQAANITFRNCTVDGRKVYQTIGNAGRPVPMGTYGYRADHVVNFSMINCRTGNDIHDSSIWGVKATNFMKNILFEDCVLSRLDVHMGASGSFIVRRSTLGHQGLNAIGRGQLIIEDSSIHANSLITFRPDYGSTWEGDVLIRNSRWIPRAGHSGTPVMFRMENDGSHDFGYPCFMPRLIQIDGLTVDDIAHPSHRPAISFFGNPVGSSNGNRPFPYRMTERLEVRGLNIASGKPPLVSFNPKQTEAIQVIFKN